MKEEFGDDTLIPLDIIKQGYKIVFAENAFTEVWHRITNEIHSRARMTLRGWQCT